MAAHGGNTEDSGVDPTARDRSLRGYLYVKVSRVGMEGGSRDRTTSPLPGLATVDAKGEFQVILFLVCVCV